MHAGAHFETRLASQRPLEAALVIKRGFLKRKFHMPPKGATVRLEEEPKCCEVNVLFLSQMFMTRELTRLGKGWEHPQLYN